MNEVAGTPAAVPTDGGEVLGFISISAAAYADPAKPSVATEANRSLRIQNLLNYAG
jgi:hypothetical protein